MESTKKSRLANSLMEEAKLEYVIQAMEKTELDFRDWCVDAKIELAEAAIKAVMEFDNGRAKT